MRISFDQKISRSIYETTKKSWVLRHVGVFFADDLIWLLIGVIGGLVLFSAQFVSSGIHTGMFVLFLLTLCIPWFVSALIARFIQRPRPYKAQGYTPIIKPFIETSAFPSSHATFSFAMLGFVMAGSIHELFWVVLIGVLLVSFGRVMVGVHRISEVVTGAIIGGVVGYVLTRFLIWILPMV